MKRKIWCSSLLPWVALALLLQAQTCERGDTYLLSLQFEVGGQNLVQGFNLIKRSGYGVVTSSSTATLTVLTRFADSTTNYQWLVGGASTDAQPIGVGGGTVTLDVPRGQSQLLVSVRAGAPNTRLGFYTVDVNRVDTDSCVGNSTGDPHLITFDRLHYDLQTVGEYVLTRSTLGGFEIQARTSPWGASRRASVNIAFAADVGGDIVSLYLSDPDVFINHQRVSLGEREKVDLPQGGSVERFRAVTEVVWPTGEIAQITRHGSYLNLQVVVPIAGGTNLVGLFGSCDGDPTNDLRPRDAISPLEQPVTFNELVYVFGNSWRILQGESLFEDVGVTDPSFPDSRVTSADLPQAVRDAAETFCLDQGVLDPILLEDCVLDYGLTQDPSFVEVYRYLFPPVAQAHGDGLVAYYPFDGNADDLSGNENHGIEYNGLAYEPGVCGQAARFDGLNDYVEAASDGLPTGERTVSLWLYADTISYPAPLLLGYGGGSCGTSWFMYLLSSPPTFAISGHCNNNTLWGPNPEPPLGAWYHWAVTTRTDGTKIFVNGEEVVSDPSLFVNNTFVDGRELAIGVDVSPGGFAPYTDSNVGWFDGMIDEVRIYNRALSVEEISVLAGSPCSAALVQP